MGRRENLRKRSKSRRDCHQFAEAHWWSKNAARTAYDTAAPYCHVCAIGHVALARWSRRPLLRGLQRGGSCLPTPDRLQRGSCPVCHRPVERRASLECRAETGVVTAVLGDGQPVLEFSWLTTHGRAASLTPTEATASPECRRS